MSKKVPPVPPANRSQKGPADSMEKPQSEPDGRQPSSSNLAEQDRHGNIKQNTTNQGYQQDR